MRTHALSLFIGLLTLSAMPVFTTACGLFDEDKDKDKDDDDDSEV